MSPDHALTCPVQVGGACDCGGLARHADDEHTYVWRHRQAGKTAATIHALWANREAKVLVMTDAQERYLVDRGVLPGQIVRPEL